MNREYVRPEAELMLIMPQDAITDSVGGFHDENMTPMIPAP